jgi:hypothetical protein
LNLYSVLLRRKDVFTLGDRSYEEEIKRAVNFIEKSFCDYTSVSAKSSFKKKS